jgi:DNA-binding response OmpR family regulator
MAAMDTVRAQRPAPPVLHAQPAQGCAGRVLVVEDERSLRETLAYNLRRAGLEVRTAGDGVAGLAAARAQPPDLVLLDVLLPGGLDGFEVCRLLRHSLRCPIILLSALADEVDRVVGLEVGADDYVTKPFSIVELLARIKAHLRRAAIPVAARSEGQRAAAPAPLQVGGLCVDPSRREAQVDGRTMHFKRREFDLLHYLARHAGMTLSRSQLLDAIWPELAAKRDTRTVDVHVHRVRDKIERDPSRPKYLRTVRGVGYVLKAPEGAARLAS